MAASKKSSKKGTVEKAFDTALEVVGDVLAGSS